MAARTNRILVLNVDAREVSRCVPLHGVTSRYIDDEIEMEVVSRAAVGKILSVETVSVEIDGSPADSVGTARAKTPP
jgi:hypothetical protein